MSAPIITLCEPTSGPQNRTVHLTGSNFTTPTVTSVKLATITCVIVILSDSSLVLSIPGSVIFPGPPAPGTYPLTVTNADGSATVSFNVIPSPGVPFSSGWGIG